MLKQLSDVQLKRLNLIAFIAVVVSAVLYIVIPTTIGHNVSIVLFIITYGVFVLVSSIRDKRKRVAQRKNQSATKEIVRTLSGAILLFLGILGVILAIGLSLNLL